MISQRYTFTSIQTILSKFYRDLKDNSISQDDLIEWIGEAMGFMKMPQIQEEAVSFLEVKDYQTTLPKGFQAVIQIAKKRNTDSLHSCKCEVSNECETKTVTDKVCEKYQDGLEDTYSSLVSFSNPLLTVAVSTSPNQLAISNNGGTLTGVFVNGGKITIGTCSTETYTVGFSNSGMIQLSNLPIDFMNCLVSTGILANLNTGTQNNNVPREDILLEEIIQVPIYNHRQLVRYRKYKNDVVIETSYEDCNGSFYQLVGTIVNCPESLNCVPCNNYKNDCSSDSVLVYNECGELINDTTLVNYFTLRKSHIDWINQEYYQHSFTPVVLTNHSFFNSIVCKEQRDIYTETTSLQDEYTVIGSFPNIALRFSFKDGIIALSHLKTQLDEEGYPLIPDDSACQAALVYYLKWKIAERLSWSGREGFANLAKDSEQHWLKYCKQFKSKTKMPFGIDQYQNLMERQHYLIPDTQKFLGYFGQLTR